MYFVKTVVFSRTTNWHEQLGLLFESFLYVFWSSAIKLVEPQNGINPQQHMGMQQNGNPLLAGTAYARTAKTP